MATERALSGRLALVSGAASDIGEAVCIALAELGAAIHATDLDGKRLASLPERLAQCGVDFGGVVPIPADLTSPAEIESLAADGGVDVFVSVAGLAHVEPFIASDSERWEQMWQLNLRAPMLVTRALIPAMVQRGWGRIVYIASDSARAGAGGEAAYAATKAGLLGFAKSIAREVAASGVTANVVCPGVIDTERSRAILGERPRLRDALLRAIPIGAFGRPDDVAAAIGYLCSPAAGYVTGQALSVNGGITMA